MNRLKVKHSLYLLFVLLLGVALSGCPKKTEVTSAPEPAREEAPTAQQSPPVAEPEKAKTEEPKETAPVAVAGLQPVHFDFDKSFIRPDAGEILRANAQWLKAHPQSKIRIEGNCDERGTIEYNQALGQRRAASAKKFLTDLGISPNRMSVISYGKEKPSCQDSTESCWQKNRRDDFIAVD